MGVVCHIGMYCYVLHVFKGWIRQPGQLLSFPLSLSPLSTPSPPSSPRSALVVGELPGGLHVVRRPVSTTADLHVQHRFQSISDPGA